MPADLDVLIVGAGPTGLSLAVQLARWGLRFRIVDALTSRHTESRALAVHARTLELLDTIGVAETLVARGRRALRVQVYPGMGPPVVLALADVPVAGTRFPFVLFVSQAETEAVLAAWLDARAVTVDRGCRASVEAEDDDAVRCRLTHADRDELVTARYVVGCDGAHSTVRHAAGVAFEGDAYPQSFMLADLEADDRLAPDAAHVFLGMGGGLGLLPLGRPRTWRAIAVGVPEAADVPEPDPGRELATLQAFAAATTGRSLGLHDVAWITRFRLHHRQAASYRRGPFLLAGDAAHIHSPAGGQGMNTGIQDAWNLGWKLGLVCGGRASDALLDSYHDERWPVGRFLLRFTDRLFGFATRAIVRGPVAARLRDAVLRRLLPVAAGSTAIRGRAFHLVSQLGIRYRSSPLAREGVPRLACGPMAGDRLPDLSVHVDGVEMPLQRLVSAQAFHLLWCRDGPVPPAVEAASAWRPIAVHLLSPNAHPANGSALAALGVVPPATGALYLVRPDGHVAYRSAGHDPSDLIQYLDEWLPRLPPDPAAP
ncbi:MAG: FAD-dependent monooxygenase [Vicinamibacterales bacterium]